MGFETWAGDAKQLPLFAAEPDEVTVKVRVTKQGERDYLATIAGGWWVAYGDTAQKAVKGGDGTV